MLVMCLVVQAQERTDKWGVPYVKLNNAWKCLVSVWGLMRFPTTIAGRLVWWLSKRGIATSIQPMLITTKKEWAQPSRKAVSLVKKYG